MLPKRRGFTLTEIIVVSVIIGILSMIAIPSYNSMVLQGAVNAAQNNLLIISAAQKNYYLNNGSYCINTSTAPCDSRSDINTAFSINLTDSYYAYTCTVGTAPSGGAYLCTATNASLPVSALGINDTVPASTQSCAEVLAGKGLTHNFPASSCQATPGPVCTDTGTYTGITYDCVACCSS